MGHGQEWSFLHRAGDALFPLTDLYHQRYQQQSSDVTPAVDGHKDLLLCLLRARLLDIES